MRFTLSALLLALIAVTTPSSTYAVSSHSTLARLSARLSAAESTLAQLSSKTSSHAGVNVPASLIGTYSFETGLADTNEQNTIKKEPATATNINVVPAAARYGSVLSRANSLSQSDTYAWIPRVIPAGSFSISLFVNWAGIFNAGAPAVTEGAFASTDNDNFKLAVHGAGTITAYVGGASIDVGVVTANKWYQVTVVYTDAQKIQVYLNGAFVGESAAGAAFPGSSRVLLLNSAARSSGLIGAVDQVYVYSGALVDPEPGFLYTDNVPAGGGFSTSIDESAPTRYWGHFDTCAVHFANRISSEPTGDITLSGKYIDADFRANNMLWVKMPGVTGTSKAATLIPGVGTVSWNSVTTILTFQPIAGTPTILRNNNWSFTIPGNALNLVNPAQGMLALSSDARWIMSPMNLDLDQTNQTSGRKQGVRWQAVIETPFTEDLNPAL